MNNKTKYKHKFDEFIFTNRWALPFYSRPSTWVIIGLGRRYFSPTEYEYYLSLFGLDFRFWFKKELISKDNA